MRTSLSTPPRRSSLPSPPSITSLPGPPKRPPNTGTPSLSPIWMKASSPLPPERKSLPEKPSRKSLSAPPKREVIAGLTVDFIVAGLAEEKLDRLPPMMMSASGCAGRELTRSRGQDDHGCPPSSQKFAAYARSPSPSASGLPPLFSQALTKASFSAETPRSICSEGGSGSGSGAGSRVVKRMSLSPSRTTSATRSAATPVSVSVVSRKSMTQAWGVRAPQVYPSRR